MAGTQPRASHWSLPWRSSALVERGGEALFVKRFHDRRPLGRLVDRWRAERERRGLERLKKAGVRAPAFSGIERTADGIELAMQRVQGARTVDEVLGDESPGGLASELGRLLARLHASGLSHADLHPGNALVDDAGRAWLIDARAVRRATPQRIAEDLARCAGAARERVTRGFRARFLIAYLRELPARIAAPLLDGATRTELAERVEVAARARRAEDAERLARRWLRESRVVARDPSDGTLRAREVLGDRPALFEAAGDRAGVLARWSDAALLAEHGVPAARPRELSASEATFAEPDPACDIPRGARGANAAGTLAGTLFDRGLAPWHADAALDARGVCYLRTGVGLERTRDLSHALAPWITAWREVTARERASFAAGFARAQRGTRREQLALRTALRRWNPPRPALQSVDQELAPG